MIGSWMLCVLGFSAFAALAARLTELALPVAVQRRHVWTGALLLSLAVPLLALGTSGAWPAGLLPSRAAIELPAFLTAVHGDVGVPISAEAPAPAFSATRVLLTLWAALSLVLLGGYLAVWLRFAGAASEWRSTRLLGHEVRIAKRLGPAVFGLRRATIVLPEWVLDTDPATQRVIMLHETEHARVRDHMMLALAPLVLVLLPWNLPLWWQLHRLRLAIEVDCDRRVLRRGVAAREYGTLLIEIASRSCPMPAALAALAEPRTLLETRILAMSTHSTPRRMRTALAAAAALLLVTAFETFTFMTPPAAAFTTAAQATAAPQLVPPMAADTPLFVVDGVIIRDGDIAAAIGDADIRSIEVIKGAAAAAQFGERGAGGVVLVTTSRAPERAPRADTAAAARRAAAAAGRQPLLVIDGVIIGHTKPTEMSPNLIESVEIIKGPAAARLYGERGAYGVIRITTKQR